MKKIFFLPLAAFIVAACSEPTASTASNDLSPSYGKAVVPPPELSTWDSRDLFTFNSDFEASAASWSGSGTSTVGISSTYNVPIEAKPSDTDDRFVGRLNDYQLNLEATNLAAGGAYSLSFDLYIIGSWDGLGRQAQQGRFGADIWSLSYSCGTGATTSTVLYETSFSNQKTVQQSYPRQFGEPGGNKAGEGRTDEDELGYTAEEVHVPLFTSFINTTYRMIFAGTNLCGSQPMSFVMTVPNALQPGNRDESWGIDNVDLRINNN